MNIRNVVTLFTLVLATVASINTHAQDSRIYIDGRSASDANVPPYSGAVLVGDTLYLAGAIGLDENSEVPDYKVEIKDAVLYYSIVRSESTNSDDFPIFANKEVLKPNRKSSYSLHLPYTIVLRLGWGGTEGMIYFFTSQPISTDKCRGFCIVGRNYNLEQEDAILQNFEQVIFDQDKRIVESQRPEQVPFDFTEELHLKFDSVAMNYRKAMIKEGLNYEIS